MKKKSIVISLCIIVILVISGELFLRFYLGMGNAPLYFASKHYEYMTQPNQDGIRFGNHYHYNSYSQRCEEPDSTKTIILGLGDSVLFGGTLTDQDSLATSEFTHEMPDMQMLNISAGSWGPDNCAAYLKEHGTFTAKAIFLLVSSHDAHDNMDFVPVVGVYPAYPNKHYKLGIWELLDRYILPRFIKGYTKQKVDPDQKVLNGIGIHKSGKVFNLGFDQLYEISHKQHIPLTVYLHADKKELKQQIYNEQGQEIIAWCTKHNVKLIKDLDYQFTPADYRDGIHINASGQRKLANILKKEYKNIQSNDQ